MAYSKSDKRFIACVVAIVVAIAILPVACGERTSYYDDGADGAQELDEYHDR